MRKCLMIMLSAIMAVLFALSVMPAFISSEAAYVPTYTTMRIGLKYGSSTLDCANLENAVGSGYEFGYFDTGRNFNAIGISTSETQISMLRDYNMYYSSGSNTYYHWTEGTSASVKVGYYHIQLDTSYSSASAAQSAAAKVTGGSTFIKYDGSYHVCIGNYTSESAANSAASAMTLPDSWSLTPGTSYTVTVVETGTNNVIMEFDCSDKHLAVRPLSTSGEKTQTWFKGYKYYGAFQYARLSGGDITVVNFVDIEDYVKCVIPYEMSNSWPLEALKAQAVCARSYAQRHISAHYQYGFDLCNTTDCQVYYGTGSTNANSDRAVEETAGVYMVSGSTLVDAVYAASDGGATENSENVWVSAVSYLKGKVDPYEIAVVNNGDLSESSYYWTRTYTSYSNMWVSKWSDSGNAIEVKLKDSSGNVRTISGGSDIVSALGVRTIHFNIYDANGNETTSSTSSSSFTIRGAGNGHNVGMSQWGAYAMAKYYDMTYDQILQFYYTGVTFSTSEPVTAAPKVTTNPSNQTVALKEKATFSVRATGSRLSYQWQYSDDGTKWVNCKSAGCNTNTFIFSASASLNGRQYRCIVSNSLGSAVSKAAKLRIKAAITVQPKAISGIVEGNTAQFSVTAVGTGLTYQWQYSANSGSTWTNCKNTGYNTTTFKFMALPLYSGRMYRCIVKDSLGNTVTSDAVKITVTAATAKPAITSQPKAQTVKEGGKATFTVTADIATSYVWQSSSDGGKTWKDCSNTSGYNKATFSFKPSNALNGRLYRCKVTNTKGTTVTDAAKLSITPTKAPTITTQPKSASCELGETVTFKVSASIATEYQWEYSRNNGESWSKWSGMTSATLTVKASNTNNGCLYRCVVSNSVGKTTSGTAKLTVTNIKPSVTAQPAAQSVSAGTTVKFTVVAGGSGLKYQWQYSDDGVNWKNCSSATYDSATFTFKASAALNNRQYRCEVSNSYGNVYSDAAKLTVK